MSKPTEPFTWEIRVGWGDCDPARIAYTARLPEFALQAIDAWWEEVVGHGWYQMNLDRQVGGPFVHLSMDFSAPVTPRHRLRCAVIPVRLGASSVEFRVEGRQDGALCFTGRFIEVFVHAEGHLRKTAPPPDFREKIEAAIAAAANG